MEVCASQLLSQPTGVGLREHCSPCWRWLRPPTPLLMPVGKDRLWNWWGGVEAQFHLKPSAAFVRSYLWYVKNPGKNSSRPCDEAVGSGQMNKYIFSVSPLLRHFSLDRAAWWATDHGVAKLDMTEHTHTHTHTHTQALSSLVRPLLCVFQFPKGWLCHGVRWGLTNQSLPLSLWQFSVISEQFV